MSADTGTLSNSPEQKPLTMADIQRAVQELRATTLPRLPSVNIEFPARDMRWGIVAQSMARDYERYIRDLSLCLLDTPTVCTDSAAALETLYGLERKETMQYVDTYGTEIMVGDVVLAEASAEEISVLGFGKRGGTGEAHVMPKGGGTPVPISRCKVVRRADGTPVRRYKNGQDVRMGDRFLFGCGGSGACNMIEVFGDADKYWRECTLVQRQGTAVTNHTRCLECAAQLSQPISMSAGYCYECRCRGKDKKQPIMTTTPPLSGIEEAAGENLDRLGDAMGLGPRVACGETDEQYRTRLVSKLSYIRATGPKHFPYITAQERYARFDAIVRAEVAKEKTFSVVTDCHQPGGPLETLVMWVQAPMVREQSFEMDGNMNASDANIAAWAQSRLDVVRKMVVKAAGEKVLAGK